MRARFAASMLLVASIVAACSGSVPSALFSTDVAFDGGSGTVTPPGTSTGSKDSGGPSTKDSGTVVPEEDGSVVEPPPPPPLDAGKPDSSVRDSGTDASTDSGTTGITCGTGACALADTCCALYTASSGTYRYECRAGRVTCPEPSTQIECDSAEDCGSGKVCCGDKATIGNYYNDVTCRTSCTNNGDVRFCNPASPAASCPAGKACRQSAILPNYYYCEP
jgi:hypothetical protein